MARTELRRDRNLWRRSNLAKYSTSPALQIDLHMHLDLSIVHFDEGLLDLDLIVFEKNRGHQRPIQFTLASPMLDRKIDEAL